MQDKWVDGEPKATQKVSLIETHLSVSKVVGFLTQARQPNGGPFRKLRPLPIKWLSFKQQDSESTCKGQEEEDEGNFEMAMSTTLLRESALEDNPVSSSLDQMLSTLYWMVSISKWGLIRDSQT